MFGNLVVLILYKFNTVLSSGFTLYFNGIIPDDQGTTHLSTYTRNPSGLIGYPVGGDSYSPSVVATWTIDTSPSLNATLSYLDINLQSINLESCPNTDPCSCDAFIVYELSYRGLLSIKERYCSSSTNQLITNTPGKFIIAFFSDAIKQPGNGDGFQLQYLSAVDPPPVPEPDNS